MKLPNCATITRHDKRGTKMPKKTIPENRTFKINPDTKQQIRDAHILADLVQVQLYEGTCGFGRDLGEPITMACALKLMKRIYAVPRPQKICLDAKDCPFFAKLIYAYPTRFNDKAVATLRLGTNFGYISPSCDIRSDYPLDECINKIRLGECQDEFIRKTVGEIMFPDLYATKNQKQR